MRHRIVTAAVLAALTCGLGTVRAAAQAPAGAEVKPVDVGVSYVAMRSLKAASSQNFWMEGGSLELGVPVWRNVSVAANLTGAHAASIGSSGVPISLITVTGGPRYRWQVKPKWSVYGEALFGAADGLDSLFPGGNAGPTSGRATSFAMQLGGGADYRVNAHVSVRALDVAYVRSQLPNGTDDVQNNLRLGAGVVLRFSKTK